LGFKVVLGYGSEADTVAAGDASSLKNVIQAYGTYIVNGKSSSPITINAGKFVTWTGQEVIESQGNWNYSHSLLFAYAIPYYHEGVSANKAFGSKLNATIYAVDGWNSGMNAVTGAQLNGKSGGYSVVYTPSTKWSITTNGIAGPRSDENSTSFLTDNIISYTINPKWTAVVNYDYGHDRMPIGAGNQNFNWQGAAAYLHYTKDDKNAVTLRAELLADPSGNMTGNSQEVKEATLTYEHKFLPRVTTRLEVREDWSTTPVFINGGAVIPTTAAGTNTTIYTPERKRNQTQLIIGNIITF
jgi:hypothetical protein